MQFAILGVNAFYFLLWGGTFFRMEAGYLDMAGLALFTLVSYFCYKSISSALELGYTFEYYLDVFIINLTSQFFVSFTVYGWIIYLAVPGYLTYQLGGYLWSYLSERSSQEPEEVDPVDAKKKAKMERKEKREKVKYMKH